MRKGVGLPQGQLLVVEGVPEYTAHHGNVLREEEQEEEESDEKFRKSPVKKVRRVSRKADG